jgi:glutathione-regulated potassium-efflux system ancillary protein KefG
LSDVTFNNLYESYPDFYIDIVREQQMLMMHDIIVWQHPFYWYSSPALLKEWFDLVLQHGFAYGEKGRALEGKTVLSVVSTGGRREVYSREGRNHYSLNQFLVPFKQSANLCRMDYLPPYIVHGSHTITDVEIDQHVKQYIQLLTDLRDEKLETSSLTTVEYLNDLYE